MAAADDSSPIATITGRDLLDRLDRLSTSVNDLGRKLDDVPERVADHEARIRVLEQARWKAVGISSLLSALLSSGVVVAVLQLVGNK